MTKTWKFMALCIALAVLFVYSVPVPALTAVTDIKSSLAIPQTDDDDDDMSGGALAVLLLAVGGAVAGGSTLTLASSSSPATNQTVNLNLTGTTANVSLAGTDSNGAPKRSAWTAGLDTASGNITLTKEGTQSRWVGKADGKYYPVIGDPSADEFSFTKVNGQTLGFSARKAGRVTLTGRMVLPPNTRSVTITKHKTDSAGRRTNKQINYKAN